MSELTAARLRELLHYDPETGFLRWLQQNEGRGRRKKNPAGSIDGEGYVVIVIAGRSYGAHRLAWLYMTGEWPRDRVDHRDGDKTNNRFDNLRDVDHSTNMQNQRRPQAHSSTGLLGVSYDKSRSKKRFRAIISVNGKPKRLGWFHTPEEASEVYLKAKRELHPGCTI